MARKDKKQVIGEPMTDEQIRVFLNVQPEAGVDPDYHALLRAYRSLRSDDFERFLAFFVEAGRNPSAPGPDGKTLLTLICDHQQSEDYREALRRIGAH